ERMVDRVPDLMLLDIEMPRMDGYELATAMKADPRLRDVPIIMITSRTGEKHRQRAMEIGVNRYLGKPYQEPELLRNVFELLAQEGKAPGRGTRDVCAGAGGAAGAARHRLRAPAGGTGAGRGRDRAGRRSAGQRCRGGDRRGAARGAGRTRSRGRGRAGPLRPGAARSGDDRDLRRGGAGGQARRLGRGARGPAPGGEARRPRRRASAWAR